MHALPAPRHFVALLLACALPLACADGPPLDELSGPAPAPPERSAPAPSAWAPKTGSPYFEGEPGENVRFIAYEATRQQSHAGAVLQDIITHLPPSYGSTYQDEDPITWGHETTHGINSDVRNYHNDTGVRANGFYVLQGRAALVEEPNIRKSDANRFVPALLRGSRYDLYLAGSQAWDDTPTYLFDEWVSYINGGEVGVDLVERGLWNRPWRDGVAGQLEFTVYALALAMAVEEGDPDYFQSNTQFLEFLAWNVKRAMEVYRTGARFEEFAWERQDTYYDNLRSAPEAEPIRAFARRVFGQPWADTYLLGLEGQPEPPADDDPNTTPDTNPDTNPDLPRDGVDLPDNVADTDRDGVENQDDLCGRSPAGRTVWTSGPWMGCAEGELRDPVVSPGPDTDEDAVPDHADLCSATPSGELVWTEGAWMGCASGQLRDADRRAIPNIDADGDGVGDDVDRCAATRTGAPVWFEGPWAGCAEGEFRDK